MRRLEPLLVNYMDVFDICAGAVRDAELRTRFDAIRTEVQTEWRQYRQRARGRTLHETTPSAHGHPEQIVLGNVTKGDFTRLYEDYMAQDGSAGRDLYDRQIMCAPLGICPYCKFGHVKSLDHFLAKAYYPGFSIFLLNLIPACKDCNSSQHGGIIDEESEISHPFFESQEIERDVWLYAEVQETVPAALTFRYDPPPEWTPDIISRVGNYFVEFDLAARFGVQAGANLVELADHLDQLQSPQLRRAHLEGIAAIERRGRRKNEWKAAMYEALAESAWYHEDGFRLPYI